MFNRRNFLKTAAATGGAAAVNPINALASRKQSAGGHFDVHPFIKNNPDAVFIMRTNVDDKMNGDAIKAAALGFSRSVFVPSDDGVPLTHLIPIKPNLTSFGSNPASVEYERGIITDPFFVEGVIEGMKELGIGGEQFYLREVNYGAHVSNHGYTTMAERTGANIRSMTTKVTSLPEEDVVWVDTPEGIWYRKIPYLYPINSEDTFMLNIAKFKAHGMGLTLCCKNLQGSIAHNYQAHCSGYNLNMDMNSEHRNPKALSEINGNWGRHNDGGVPRWDKPGSGWNSGLGMEAWASRCIDNNNATPCGLHIIEGVCGRDGNFLKGPHKSDGTTDLTNSKGLAKDHMSNVVIFGKNQYNNDIIGHWLGGHEPGNMGLFHMAIDFGLNNYLNPFDVPVYEWVDGEPVLTPLGSFERTPLLTYYMQDNYGGGTENYWHMMDQPYDYGTVSVNQPKQDGSPKSFVLGQNRPNPFNPNTSIEYRIPQGGHAKLDIYNASGQLVDVLVDGHMSAGSHLATWNTSNHSSGVYFYRFHYAGFSETKKMTLIK